MEENIKEQLFNFCKEVTDTRVARIQENIKGYQNALHSETKSSAGDKHETGRAMIQLEIEKAGAQLAEAESVYKALKAVNINTAIATIGLGNLVKTSMANYFIATSAGEFKYNNTTIYCISPITPIGKLLFGKKVNDIVTFNKKEIQILEIL
ncbi:GreA/GreB family elongation factor [Cellulophaga baltica]|uniref:GreA/GreB family elongation factor n=1 Tax=Cellulophaga TaxID=104264 RepID=UPI001C0773D8|nr:MULTISPECIES: GreA/GreB family elongation factor [Cellulophaga]MBU2995807.1 GreA/GreB family elongation factor [Cellulophaga baltica]MDO6767202.1 GreA/GreB family elongation factor [Cellulophaga sp. 1_MG-2023]